MSERARSAEEEAQAGGELLLWPDLFENPKNPTLTSLTISKKKDSEETSSSLLPLSVPPREGRLVLFSACRMPHAVAPSRKRRHCFTVWLSEGEEERRRRGGRGTEDFEEKKSSRERVLSSAAGRRAVAKVLLSPRWRRSLVAAHPPGPGLDRALETHDGDTRRLAEVLEKAGVVAEVEGDGGGEKSWELVSKNGNGNGNKGDSPMRWF